MRGRRNLIGVGAAALVAALGALPGTVAVDVSRMSETTAASPTKGTVKSARHALDLRALFGTAGYGMYVSQRRRGPGWTNRHVQRMARKRRNVLRNRRAHRGSRA